MKRRLRNSYLGLVPLRVICEVGDGGRWHTDRETTYDPYVCTYGPYMIICIVDTHGRMFKVCFVFGGRTNGRTVGRTVGRSRGWTDGRTDGRTDAWMDGRTVGRTVGRSDERSEERSDERSDARGDGRTDVRTVGPTVARTDEGSDERSEHTMKNLLPYKRFEPCQRAVHSSQAIAHTEKPSPIQRV